jgi:hypothetical protein
MKAVTRLAMVDNVGIGWQCWALVGNVGHWLAMLGIGWQCWALVGYRQCEVVLH